MLRRKRQNVRSAETTCRAAKRFITFSLYFFFFSPFFTSRVFAAILLLPPKLIIREKHSVAVTIASKILPCFCCLTHLFFGVQSRDFGSDMKGQRENFWSAAEEVRSGTGSEERITWRIGFSWPHLCSLERKKDWESLKCVGRCEYDTCVVHWS